MKHGIVWICRDCEETPPCRLICPGVDPPICCVGDGKECDWKPETKEDEDGQD